jgi:hypothetical protein
VARRLHRSRKHGITFTGTGTFTRDLEVYQLAVEFHALACTLVAARGFRNLRDQLDRASLGVVLCIAEGARRCSTCFGCGGSSIGSAIGPPAISPYASCRC